MTDYLLKKGYKRTEEIFRQEVKDLDENGRPRQQSDGSVSDRVFPAGKYLDAFKHYEKWVDNGLDLYKVSAAMPFPLVFLASYAVRSLSLVR